MSVITVFLDGENFIGEAIASVQAQSVEDWEHILVDDGSTDGSSAIARALASGDSRVTYLDFPNHENHGLAAGRILGSGQARGEYVLFLDHDDVLHPDALRKLVAALDADASAAAVFAAVRYWIWDDALPEKESIQSFALYGSGPVAGRRMLRDLIQSEYRHPAICSTMFRRQALLMAHDLTRPYDGIYEDTAILFKLLCRNDVVILDEPVADYRIHAASMCQQAIAAGTLAGHGWCRDRERFLCWAFRTVPLDAGSRLLLAVTLVRDRLRRRSS